MALATAIAGTRLAVATGLVSFEAHRFLAPDVPVVSVVVGGALFGTGMVLAGAIGLLAPLGWIGTGFLLLDDFDPIPLQSMGFTGPAADTLFWTMAATSIPAGFGAGLVAGVIAGSLAAALAAGEFRWQSLESPRQTGRYLAGAVMMGAGGEAVLAECR